MSKISKLIDTQLLRVCGTLRMFAVDQQFAVDSAKKGEGLISAVH
jgi:hypothetical protein